MDQNPYESPRETNDKQIDPNTVSAWIIGIGLTLLGFVMFALSARIDVSSLLGR